jgi:hypothetical protein
MAAEFFETLDEIEMGSIRDEAMRRTKSVPPSRPSASHRLAELGTALARPRAGRFLSLMALDVQLSANKAFRVGAFLFNS